MSKVQPAFVTFEQAKLLKQKGFDERSNCFYKKSKTYVHESSCAHRAIGDNLIAAQHWQVVEWLWETYGIDVSVIPCKEKGTRSVEFQFRVINFSDPEIDEVLFEHQYNTRDSQHTTRREAYSAAIDYILKNLL